MLGAGCLVLGCLGAWVAVVVRSGTSPHGHRAHRYRCACFLDASRGSACVGSWIVDPGSPLPFLSSPMHFAKYVCADAGGWIGYGTLSTQACGSAALPLCYRLDAAVFASSVWRRDDVGREAVRHSRVRCRATFLARDRPSGTSSGGQGSSWNDEVHIISRNGADGFQSVPCGLAGLINLGSYLTQYHPVDAWHAPPQREGQERAMLYPIQCSPIQTHPPPAACSVPSPSPGCRPMPRAAGAGQQGRTVCGRRQVQLE